MSTVADKFFGPGHDLHEDVVIKDTPANIPEAAPEAKRAGLFDRVKGALGGSFSQVADSMFQAKDRHMDRFSIKEGDGMAMKMGKSMLLAGGILSKVIYDTVGNVTGVKVGSDLPLSVLQNAVVKNRKGEMTKLFSGEAAFEEKKNQLEELMTSSSAVKKLKPEELAGFRAQMATIHEMSDEYGERSKAFEALIDNYLQAKTSAMTVARSGLNAAFVGLGMNVVRGVSFLTLKTIETARESQLESERSKFDGAGKSTGEIFKQKLIAGVRNTVSFGLSSAKENRTKIEIAVDTAKAAGTILTFFGMAHSATAEMEHGSITENISRAMDLLRENGWGQVGANFVEVAKRAWQTYTHPVDTFNQMQAGIGAQWNRWFGNDNAHKIDAVQQAAAVAYSGVPDGMPATQEMTMAGASQYNVDPAVMMAGATAGLQKPPAIDLDEIRISARPGGEPIDLNEIKITAGHHGGDHALPIDHENTRVEPVDSRTMTAGEQRQYEKDMAAATAKIDKKMDEMMQAKDLPLHKAGIRPAEQLMGDDERRMAARFAQEDKTRAQELLHVEAPAPTPIPVKTGLRERIDAAARKAQTLVEDEPPRVKQIKNVVSTATQQLPSHKAGIRPIEQLMDSDDQRAAARFALEDKTRAQELLHVEAPAPTPIPVKTGLRERIDAATRKAQTLVEDETPRVKQIKNAVSEAAQQLPPQKAGIRPAEQLMDSDERRAAARFAQEDKMRANVHTEAQAPDSTQPVKKLDGIPSVKKGLSTLRDKMNEADRKTRELLNDEPVVRKAEVNIPAPQNESLSNNLSHYGMKIIHAPTGDNFSFEPSQIQPSVLKNLLDHRTLNNDHPFISEHPNSAALLKIRTSLRGGDMVFDMMTKSYQIGVLEHVSAKMPAGADRDSVLSMKNMLMKGLEKSMTKTADVIDQAKVMKMIAAVAKNPDKFSL